MSCQRWRTFAVFYRSAAWGRLRKFGYRPRRSPLGRPCTSGFGQFQPFAFMFQRSFNWSLIGHSRTMPRFRKAILLQPSTPKQIESRTRKSDTAARTQNLVSKSNDFLNQQIQVIATFGGCNRDRQTMRSVHRCVGQGHDASFLKPQHDLSVERHQCFVFAERIGQQRTLLPAVGSCPACPRGGNCIRTFRWR